ncbi:unnamed protein product [Gordionus sp. m RMFG-2023]
MDILNPADKEIKNIEVKIENLDRSLEKIFDETILNLYKTKEFIKENGSISLSKFLVCEYLNLLKDSLSKSSTEHKDIHSLISKFGKIIEKNFVSNYYDACLDPNFENPTNIKILNEMICEHFFRHGICLIADNLIRESNIVLSKEQKEPFIELNNILQSLKQKDLQPAIKWTSDHHEELLAKNSDLEFKIHRLSFLEILSLSSTSNGLNCNNSSETPTLNQTKMALIYAAKKLTPFANCQMKEFQKLMGYLLFANNQNNDCNDKATSGNENKTTAISKYDDYAWEEIEELFVREACALLGFSTESPLSVSFSCGVKAYPALLNIKQMMQQRHVTGVWNSHVKDELPVEVDLGTECRFHSIFACPILRQQSNSSNPPMRLKCGHVISREALNKLANVSKYNDLNFF